MVRYRTGVTVQCCAVCYTISDGCQVVSRLQSKTEEKVRLGQNQFIRQQDKVPLTGTGIDYQYIFVNAILSTGC